MARLLACLLAGTHGSHFVHTHKIAERGKSWVQFKFLLVEIVSINPLLYLPIVFLKHASLLDSNEKQIIQLFACSIALFTVDLRYLHNNTVKHRSETISGTSCKISWFSSVHWTMFLKRRRTKYTIILVKVCRKDRKTISLLLMRIYSLLIEKSCFTMYSKNNVN